jgi:hypothetical protein
MITERVDGIWNRIIVAGVEEQQVLISHLITGLFVNSVHLIEASVFVFIFLAPNLSTNAAILVQLILFLNGTAGVVFGVVVSIACNSFASALNFNLFFMNLGSFACGKLLNLNEISMLCLTQYFQDLCGQFRPFHRCCRSSHTYSLSHFPQSR